MSSVKHPVAASSGDSDSNVPGRIDTERRRQLIQATLQVIVDQGVAGLSHRRVAKQAGVSLSATTYYFGTRDDLIEEAFAETVDSDRHALSARFEDVPPGTDVVEMLALVVHERISEQDTAVLIYELLVASLRSERLRRLNRTWEDSWHEILRPYFADDTSARMMVALMGGVIQSGLMSEQPMTVGEIAVILRRGLDLVPASS